MPVNDSVRVAGGPGPGSLAVQVSISEYDWDSASGDYPRPRLTSNAFPVFRPPGRGQGLTVGCDPQN